MPTMIYEKTLNKSLSDKKIDKKRRTFKKDL